jgi:transcriptional regulator of arginine metabolism
MTKTQRQAKITELLEKSAISTAAQLVGLLQTDGWAVTQATVTRDLQELGSIKIRDEHGSRRIVLAGTPKVAPAPVDHLRRMMGEWVISVECSQNLVVVRTPPGCAHVVASALDRSALSGVLGSIAGDDTVLIVASEAVGAKAVMQQLRFMAGLDSTDLKGKSL